MEMTYSMGKRLRFTLFGKSHGPHVGCVLEGVPKGLAVDIGAMDNEMALRRPKKGIGTPRREADPIKIRSGLEDGVTDGTPMEIIIANADTDGGHYLQYKERPRPGHADLPALARNPDHDIRGGGQYSGRLTAPIVAAGSVAKQLLLERGIAVSAFSRSIGGIVDDGDRDFDDAMKSRAYDTRACTGPLHNDMEKAILAASADGDSVGGVVECIAKGMPLGFGGTWFESLDSEVASAVFSIPACKGVEFGKGFALAGMRGSESNDPFTWKSGKAVAASANMGGILGGMSDGSPMVFRAVFKPTPSIAVKQHTVDLSTGRDVEISVSGRHDPCIVPRAVAAVEAVTALVLADFALRDGSGALSGKTGNALTGNEEV